MIKYLFPALLAGTILTLPFAPSVAETLDEAVSFAVEHHPSVMAAEARLGAAGASVREEKSAYYPTASASASFGRIFADNTTTRGLSTVRGTGYSWYGEGRAALNQKLYDFAMTQNRVNSAQSSARAADFLLADRRDAIAFIATQSYIQMVRANTLNAQAIDHLKSMKNYYTRIKSAVDNGGGDESELSRAQDIISLAENTVAQTEADLDIAKAGYVEAVGRLSETPLVEPAFDMTDLPDVIDDAIAMALSRHPQIAAAKQDANAAHYTKRSQNANLYPTVDAELSMSKRDQKDLIGGESEDARALVKMNWAMSLGGGELAAQRRAAEQEKEAMYIVDELSRTIERDVKIAWTSMHLAAKQKKNEARRLEAAKRTLATFTEQYDGGQKKVLELMTAEMQAFNADQSYNNLVYRELDAAFALKSLLGREG